MRAPRGRPPARRRARRRAASSTSTTARRGRGVRGGARARPTCSARELELPVFLYGALAGGRTRAELRRGGPAELARRIAAGELRPTSARRTRTRPPARRSSPRARRSSRSTSSWRRPRRSTTPRDRRAHPRGRRGGAGRRARDRPVSWRASGVAQVSMNVEDPAPTPLREVVAAVRAPRARRRGRAGRARPRGGVRGLPGRRRRPRLRPGPAPDRERPGSLGFGMAQTKKKRRTKHRGNAAGTIESRGRTGRKPTRRRAQPEPQERRARSAPARQAADVAQRDQRAPAIAAGIFLVAVVVLFKQAVAGRDLGLAAFMLALYIPIGYYTDLFLYRRRRESQKAGARKPARTAGMDVRMFTVGLVQENCLPAAPRRRRPRADRRPRRRGRRGSSPRSTSSG